MFKNFIFQSSNNPSATTDFLSLNVEYISVIYFQKIFKRLIVEFTTLINPYFIWFSLF